MCREVLVHCRGTHRRSCNYGWASSEPGAKTELGAVVLSRGYGHLFVRANGRAVSHNGQRASVHTIRRQISRREVHLGSKQILRKLLINLRFAVESTTHR